MAKTREKTRVTRRTVVEEIGGEPGETGGAEVDLTGAEGAAEAMDPEEMDALAKLRGLSGGDSMARYEVRRVMPSSAAGYCGTLGDEELTMERIADEYGPGTYTIRVRLPGGKFAGSDRVQVADLPKHRQNAQAPAPVVSAAPAAGGDRTGELVAAMQRATDSQIQMLSGLMKSLIERPLPTPPPPPPPPDTIAILSLAAKMFGDRGDKGGGIELFMKGLEFGKELGGSGETDFGDLLVKGIDGIKELSQAQAGAQPRRRLPPPGSVPAREPAKIAGPTPQVRQQANGASMNTMQLLQWLNQQVKHLLVQASRGKNPELYAEVFLDNLPPGLTDETILAQLRAPDAVQKLAKLNAAVLQYREWFESFRAECVRMLTEEEGPEADEDDEDDGDDGQTIVPGELPAEFPPDTGGGEGQ